MLHQPPAPIRRLAAGLLLAALVLAACQPDEDEPAQAPDTPEADEDVGDPTPVPPTTATPTPTPTPPRAPRPTPDTGPALAAHGVSAGHPAAVDVGMDVLAAGGNAVDAAVATAYAVSVAEPFGSGIGGGGMALVMPPGGDPVAYDFREVVRASGDVPASNTGIPGFRRGHGAAPRHLRHGRAR